MYLTQLKKHPPTLSVHHTRFYCIADAVLNSERDVHQIMQNTQHLSQHQFLLVRHHVFNALHGEYIGWETDYPVEAITYLIIKDWWNNHEH